ncbi:MAG TPA: pyridoxamine 5'-phosphate oxidase family protein [Candidatus Saccharimonadales bacterium]
MNDNEKAKQFLQDQEYMVIAVTLEDSTPWALPVRLRHWDGNVFEWDSMLATEHSKALERSPEMAITIFQKFSDSQTGIYAKGHGELVEEKDHGLGRYRFTAEKVWLNDETFKKREVELG